jgi:hypothetical protein
MAAPFTPVQMATYVRQKLSAKERGAILVHNTADRDVVLVVFGNDRYLFDKRVNQEVELIRQWLTAAGAREQGFGVSPDGHSWAMILQIDNRRYRTPAGCAFYAEMVRIEVEEEVDKAWLAACGASPSPASRGAGRSRRRAG